MSRYLSMIIFCFLWGLFYGGSLVAENHAGEKKGSDKEMLQEASARFEQLELFNKVLYLIETQFYREIDIKKLIQGAIKGMLDTLDPHSGPLFDDVFTKMQNDTTGEFGGIGIEVAQKDGAIYVVHVFDETPASEVGLRSGDQIVQVDHRPLLGMSLDKAVKLMMGEAQTKVKLTILREREEMPLTFTLTRRLIKTYPVKYEIVDKNFAYIRLSSFQAGGAKMMREALKKMKESSKKEGGLSGIIFDLRFNPGGLLDEAVEVSSLFLKEGVVVSTEGRTVEQQEVKNVVNNGEKELTLPIVVLVNGSSASASEIVAGALQDYKRAIIMGVPTFGKGSVQSVMKIDDKNGIKLTIAQYLTPLKRKIQAVGIMPDIYLDSVEADWVAHHIEDDAAIREVDLYNHLNATIESAEEKRVREEREQKKREERVKVIEMRKKKEEKGSEDKEKLFNRPWGKNDYQVMRAVEFLKSFSIYQKITSQK